MHRGDDHGPQTRIRETEDTCLPRINGPQNRGSAKTALVTRFLECFALFWAVLGCFEVCFGGIDTTLRGHDSRFDTNLNGNLFPRSSVKPRVMTSLKCNVLGKIDLKTSQNGEKHYKKRALRSRLCTTSAFGPS